MSRKEVEAVQKALRQIKVPNVGNYFEKYPLSAPYFAPQFFDYQKTHGKAAPSILVVQKYYKCKTHKPSNTSLYAHDALQDENVGYLLRTMLKQDYQGDNVAYYHFAPEPATTFPQPTPSDVRTWLCALIEVMEILKPQKVYLVGRCLAHYMEDEKPWKLHGYTSFQDFLTRRNITYCGHNLRLSNAHVTKNLSKTIPDLQQTLQTTYDTLYSLADFLEYTFDTRENFLARQEKDREFFRENPTELYDYDEDHPENLEQLIQEHVVESSFEWEYFEHEYDKSLNCINDLLSIKIALAKLQNQIVKKSQSSTRIREQNQHDATILRIAECLARKKKALSMKKVGLARICVDILTSNSLQEHTTLFDDTLIWLLETTNIKRGLFSFDEKALPKSLKKHEKLVYRIQEELRQKQSLEGTGRASWTMIKAAYRRLKANPRAYSPDLAEKMKTMFLKTTVAHKFGSIHSLKSLPKDAGELFFTP